MRLLAIFLLAATGIYAAGDAVLAPAPTPEHPGFVDAVLASRAALAVIRLAVIFVGAFVIASVVGLTARRQWLTKVGPVEVSDVDAERHRRGEELRQARETIARLRQQLSVDGELLTACRGRGKSHMNDREVREVREGNRRAIELADEAIKRIDENLRDSERRVAKARAKLKRAGYLR